MRTLVQLSDLHFHAVDHALLDPLVAAVQECSPDLVVVSGDLTQHAWPSEFAAAREFLERLPHPQLVIPGNHDLSFYNPMRRLAQGRRLFERHITADREPFYEDAEVAVLGLDTTRVFHLRDGRIRPWQVERLEGRMRAVPPGVVRVLTTHHPFDLAAHYSARELVGRRVIARVVRHVDVLLAGHLHSGHTGHTAMRHREAGASAIFVQAGTALSTRVRGEPNSFSVLRIQASEIAVERWDWQLERGRFLPTWERRFARQASGWQDSLRLGSEIS